MILLDFMLRPLPGSKFHFRVRLFDSKRAMESSAVAEGSMTGEAQACFAGATDRRGPYDGDVYLFDSPALRSDAIHELTHAAVHYVRETRGGDLAEPNHGEYASAAEELLCRSMEHLLWKFSVRYARFETARENARVRSRG